MSRILFITSKPYYPWEGACHRIRHDLEALVALGYTVDLLTVPVGQPLAIPGLKCRHVPRLPFCRRLPEGPSVRRFLLDTLMFFYAVFLSGRISYQLIHGIDDAGVVAWLAARLTKTPCVFERLSSPRGKRVQGARRFWLGLNRALETRALKRADAVIGNDTATLNMLTRFGRRSRTCLIPDIPAVTDDIPLPALNLAKARYRHSPGQPLITCVGSYTRFQGLDLFFNAIPFILEVLPDARFAVVGGDNAEITRMRGALTQVGMENAVTFPGRIPSSELAALLAVSDVLVSSRRAGTTAPVKVLDYLHSGTPIAAVGTPANRAILSEENAVLTHAAPNALADGIIRLCTDPVLRARLGQKGLDTLRQENRYPQAFRQALGRCYAYVLTTAPAP